MKALPHALLYATQDSASPPVDCGLLVRDGATCDSLPNTRFLLVDPHARVETLRSALAKGMTGFGLTGWRTGADLQRLAALLSVAEAEEGRPDGTTPILAITDGILPSPIAREGLASKTPRFAALVWDHQLLKQTLCATRALTESGAWTAPFATARAATLLTAALAGVPAYDSFADGTGAAFTRACERSRDDGFFGSLAEDAAQIATIGVMYRPRG